MSNWDIYMDYFANAVIPYSEYLWIVVVMGISIYALLKSRNIVSKL